MTVSIGGGISGRTLIALDGTTTWDAIQGGTQMNFSSVNYDLSTGITSSGAVNVVTRSGGNNFHGCGHFFFCDHNMAAYPGLACQTSSPNPFFARRNPGFLISGPIAVLLLQLRVSEPGAGYHRPARPAGVRPARRCVRQPVCSIDL